jgi:hypothetical protein
VVFKIQELESQAGKKSESDSENSENEDSIDDDEDLNGKGGPTLGNKEFMAAKCVMFTCIGMGLKNKAVEMR